MAQAVTDAVAASIKAAGGANNYWFGANANGTGGGSKDFTVAEDPLGIGWTPVSSQFTTSIQQAVDAAFGAGGVSAALTAAKTGPDYTGAPPWLMGAAQGLGYSASTVTQYLGPYQSTLNDKISNVDALTQLQNAQTTDKGAQIGNLQTELAWLQTLPESLARDQKIVSLQQSIDQLKTATDANTAATLATLNPLYSQGHGALAIGYFRIRSRR